MIEKNFDIPFIADLALREKQNQQNYRPIMKVYKWSSMGRRFCLGGWNPAFAVMTNRGF